jgi:hypothetical protein
VKQKNLRSIYAETNVLREIEKLLYIHEGKYISQTANFLKIKKLESGDLANLKAVSPKIRKPLRVYFL